MLDLAKRFSEAFGVSGYEDEIRATIREVVSELVDDVRVDTMGNLIALRKGTASGQTGQARRVMLAAHMDQIGLMITHVDGQGYLKFAPIGGVHALACWGSQVRFADGTVGSIGLDGRADPASKVPALQEMYVDVGAASAGTRLPKVGDVAAFWRPFIAQGDAWFAPNLDDRIGCAMLAQLLRELIGREIADDLYAVFTTQEEVGPRGALTSTYTIEPDVAIALDVTATGDTPHARPAMEVSLGAGAAIKVQDSGLISHRGVNRLLVAAAEAAHVPYQMEILLRGTTDAHSMQAARGGIPASCVSVPCRYIHTPSQLIDRRDAEGGVAMLASFLSHPIEL